MPFASSRRSNRAAESPRDRNRPLKFNGDNAFHQELRRRVDAEFKRMDCRQRDSAKMYLKAGVILGTFTLTYLALVFLAASIWQAALLSILLGIATAGIGFNVMHDGGHQAWSDRRWINRLMAMTVDVIGGSSYIWGWKHGRFHHTWANVAGYDDDIDLGMMARLSPLQRRQPWHRWQHFYLWFLYGFVAIRWHLYDDFRDIITGTVGQRPFVRPRGRALAVFILGKLAFFMLAFGLPLLFHPIGTVLVFYAMTAFVAGVLLALVFQMAHVTEAAAFPEPNAGTMQMHTPWAIHQMQTTVDFARTNRVLSWMIGGLNFQVEHHLFPRISHVHYPMVSRVVKDTCREFGVVYLEQPTFGAAIASHYRWLRRLGMPA